MSLDRPLYYGDPASISAASGFLRSTGFVGLAFAGDQCNLEGVTATILTATTINVTTLNAAALALTGPVTLTGAATAAQPLLDVVGTPVGAGGSSIYAEADAAAAGSAALYAARNRSAAGGAGQFLATIIADLEGNAADAGVAPTGLHVRALTYNAGVDNYQGLLLEGNADTLGGAFAHAVNCLDSPCIIEAANVTAALAAPNSRFATGDALAGETSGSVTIATGDSDTAAADVVLAPGVDTVATNHGTVQCVSSAAAQVPLSILGNAAQAVNLQEWQLSTGYARSAVANNGDFHNLPISTAAGAASSFHYWDTLDSSSNTHFVRAGNDGSAVADTADFFLASQEGDILRVTSTWGVGNSALAFLGGTGLTPAARAGQLTDNTGAAAGSSIDAVAGADTVSATNVGNNFKRLLDRVNALEQIIKDVGFST